MSAQIFDLNEFNAATLPAYLRALADEFDRGGLPDVEALLVVLDRTRFIEVRSAGRAMDMVRRAGLLHSASVYTIVPTYFVNDETPRPAA